MATEVYFEGTANGEALAETEYGTRTPTVAGDDVSQMVECLSFSTGIETPQESGGFAHVGRHNCLPIQITFRMTGSTWPMWLKACNRNEPIEGTFHFYRPSLDAGLEKSGTIEITRSRVVSVVFESPSTVSAETASLPPLVHVTIAYHTLTASNEDSKVETVSWAENA